MSKHTKRLLVYDRPEFYLLERGRLYPVLLAALSPSGKTLVVWCRYCDSPHCHSPEPSDRAAHCFVDDSPYRETGYEVLPIPGLQPADLVPPRAQRHRLRRRSRFDMTLVHGWKP